jgi:hypothetical protein
VPPVVIFERHSMEMLPREEVFSEDTDEEDREDCEFWSSEGNTDNEEEDDEEWLDASTEEYVPLDDAIIEEYDNAGPQRAESIEW